MHPPTVRYTIAMTDPHSHLFHITFELADLAQPTVALYLPVWTPGSYMIREYSRHVEQFAASDAATGAAVGWRKTRKDCWQIDTLGVATLRVTYCVYAYELTVRTSHLDDSHGYFNGATVCMYMPERTHEPALLRVEPPPGSTWQITTGLPYATTAAPVGEPQTFRADSYDHLIDSPVECGTHRCYHFTVANKPHTVAFWGHGNEDAERVVADTRTIVETQYKLFGSLPYDNYTFMLHLADRYGGLEHHNSASNQYPRWGFRDDYERFLELQSHEFFHLWNVKRIRAAPLGPFDYQHENYTRLLWAMEGVTSYYDRLLLVRAGLMSPTRYLETLGEDIARLQNTPGRHYQTLEEASFDAWIKFYRRDEHTDNSAVSYYSKGALVILLLDLEIRHQTAGERSFDDVLRYLHQHYPLTQPGIPEDGGYLAAIEAAVGDGGGVYRQLFTDYIAGTTELDYARAFAPFGITVEWGYSQPQPNDTTAPAWIGMRTTTSHGRTTIASVRRDSPAAQAGVYAHDELVALNGWRVDSESLPQRISEHRPGDTVTVSVFRRDELRHIAVVLAALPHDRVRLHLPTAPTAHEQALLTNWLQLSH